MKAGAAIRAGLAGAAPPPGVAAPGPAPPPEPEPPATPSPGPPPVPPPTEPPTPGSGTRGAPAFGPPLLFDRRPSGRGRKAFGADPSATDDDAVLADVGKALAAFVETFETPPTPFDRFRNALARGEPIRPWIYSEAAQRGVRIFVGKGGCSNCHSGPNFSNGELRDNGVSVYAAKGRPDPGRNGTFKVPTLPHPFLTAPYGPHGEAGAMADAVRP